MAGHVRIGMEGDDGSRVIVDAQEIYGVLIAGRSDRAFSGKCSRY